MPGNLSIEQHRRLVRLRKWVAQPAGVDPGPFGQGVRTQLAIRHDVLDLEPLGQQVVGDQPPVTAPVQPLGAHEGGRLPPGEFQELLDRLVELRGRHVVGVVAEALVPQAKVSGRVPGPLATATQGLHPAVLDSRLGQLRGEVVPVEVRVLPGAGEPPDVGQGLDAVPGQEASGTRRGGGSSGRWCRAAMAWSSESAISVGRGSWAAPIGLASGAPEPEAGRQPTGDEGGDQRGRDQRSARRSGTGPTRLA